MRKRNYKQLIQTHEQLNGYLPQRARGMSGQRDVAGQPDQFAQCQRVSKLRPQDST